MARGPSTPLDQATPFHRYYREHTPERTAETLSALLGKKITKQDVTKYGRKKNPPETWREALGLAEPGTSRTTLPSEDDGMPPGEAPPSAEPGRQSETEPKPPEGAKVYQLPVPTGEFAKKRIASAYQLVGAGLAEGVGNSGVGKVWDDHSEPIAQAWLDAADSSEFARKFVAFMTAGGPMGEVVMLHVTMMAGTLYVLGQFPEVGFFGKYSAYRPQRPGPGEGAEGADEPGSTGKGTARPVAAG